MRFARRRPRSVDPSTAGIKAAFEELRKHGYFARMNFWCCQSCAWADVPDAKAQKVVFYHKQDKDELVCSGRTMLAWAGDSKFICEVLEKHGVDTQHNGSEHERIYIAVGVGFPEAPKPPKEPDPLDTGTVVWA